MMSYDKLLTKQVTRSVLGNTKPSLLHTQLLQAWAVQKNWASYFLVQAE